MKPALVIEPSRGWRGLDLRGLWEYRELLGFLVWRDLKVRYRQTLVGAAWAVLHPLLTLAVLTVIFGVVAQMPSEGYPYTLFVYCGLVPWIYFSGALSLASTSLVGDASLLTKVYFPRLVIPVAAVIRPLAELGLSLAAVIGLAAWMGVVPTWRLLTLPVFVLFATVTALAVTVWLSALHVHYRDVGYMVPLLVQLWMFVSPVAYPVSLVPERWRPLYSLNPIAGVIEGFRWAVLGKTSPALDVVAASAVGVAVLLAGGLVVFRRLERSFADVV